MRCLISLGSNMGNRRKYLDRAVELINIRAGRVLKRSSVIETSPYGYTAQADFLNMALLVDTDMMPLSFLCELQKIEGELGRVRKIHWGPRTVDLDIILIEDKIIDEPDLKVPHPDFRNRGFVLHPAAEIVPDAVDPVTGLTMKELLDQFNEGSTE